MVDKIFERIDLGVLSEMLLYGNMPEEQAIGLSCEARLKAAETELLEQLKALRLGPGPEEDVQEAVVLFMIKAGPIYMELGMKAGVALYRSLQGEMSGPC